MRFRLTGLRVMLLGGLLSMRTARADEPVVLNTGVGLPLVSEVRAVTAETNLIEPRLRFNFGFATDEISAPGTFLDSFTVTLQDSNQLFTAVYVTMDADRFALAPPTPGALFVDPDTISTVSIAYPGLTPLLPNRTAYAFTALIPPEFLGSTFNVIFDLFDNLDLRASQGWFSDLRVEAVPEPRTLALLLMGGACWWRINRMKK